MDKDTPQAVVQKDANRRNVLARLETRIPEIQVYLDTQNATKEKTVQPL